jgi:hypothetical protein
MMDRNRLDVLLEWGTIADIPELAGTILRLAERVGELEQALELARDAVHPEAFPSVYEATGRVLNRDWKAPPVERPTSAFLPC